MKVLESYSHLDGHCQMKHDESEYKYEIDAAVVMSLELTTNCSISKNDLFFGFVCESVLMNKPYLWVVYRFWFQSNSIFVERLFKK